MAEIVNLRRARKAKARHEKAGKAEQNRVQYGIAKPLREASRAIADKDRRKLDNKKKD